MSADHHEMDVTTGESSRSSLPLPKALWEVVHSMTRFLSLFVAIAAAALPRAHAVEAQPLGANLQRVIQAMEYLGSPLPKEVIADLKKANQARDAEKLQAIIDPHVLLQISINPEERVKVARGKAKAVLQQGGYTPVLIKVANQSTATKRLRIHSPQAGAIYAGPANSILRRQAQTHLASEGPADHTRFLAVEIFRSQPMTEQLSGLEVEYVIALIYARESGKREATLAFDIGQGTQDLGFRGEVPVLFEIRPAVAVPLTIRDTNGKPSYARLQFEDSRGQVYPPQAKRLAPDLFFQKHIYRSDGETVHLPPGRFTMKYSRGPEYRVLTREVTVSAEKATSLVIDLKRWVNAEAHGFFSGDHHIHGAGCAHYTDPTLGVTPEDMFRQVKGEGLNVGCILTWGPCFEHQRTFFSPTADGVSDGETILKYDLEISGFGSQALGHVCLLNLKDQTYPGSDGTKTKGWPSWTTPVMRWAKKQGGVTGYAHSASGLQIVPGAATRRLLERWDLNKDEMLDRKEAKDAFLPELFAMIDRDRDGVLTRIELVKSHRRAADQLPNFAVPEMNGVGAMEICVSVSEGVCDFISSMDTRRIQEWNTWYHLLNCGFPLVTSGETDFPCMSSRRVGQGRVYVQLGKEAKLDFETWVKALAQGRSYVSDGFAHALSFTVNGTSPGFGEVELAKPETVTVETTVTFSPETPNTVAQGLVLPKDGKQLLGDTVNLHAERDETLKKGGNRLVELVVNGKVIADRAIPADGKEYRLKFEVPIAQSSWVALRQFPQLHTNPVRVLVEGKPIRASKRSAHWCIAMTELLWKNRKDAIRREEREEAKKAFDRTFERFHKIAEESLN